MADFLDRYYTNEGIKSAKTVSGYIKALKASLGHLPVAALEKAGDIARFKTT